MTESQENLQIVQANRKFWEYMIDEKNKIQQEELQKLDDAKEKYLKIFHQFQIAPRKLAEATKNEKALQLRIEKEREIPATDRQEVLSLIDTMRMKLRSLGVAC